MLRGESVFREANNSTTAFHRDGEQPLREGDPPILTLSSLAAAGSAQMIARSGVLTLCAARLAARKAKIGRWVCISAALLLLMVPSAALAQETSAKAQPGNKAPTGEGNGSRDKQPVSLIDPNYVIAPQDTLDISVWKEPDLTRTVPVRPDGKISLPLLDDVQAGGLTPTQLAADIAQRLKKYFTDPRVTVIVTTIASQRFYVLGEVTRAGAYPLLPGLTLLQALSSAGGFTQFANPKNIYLLRVENGKQVKHPFNYKDVVNGKNPNQNLELKSGDTIVVP